MSFFIYIRGVKIITGLNLVIDIGNTFTKIAVFREEAIFELTSIASNQLEKSVNFIDETVDRHNIKQVIVCSVGIDHNSLFRSFPHRFNKFIFFDHLTPIPINNLYMTSETLGKDRLAAITAAHHLYNNRNVLVFDAGTALTIDFISKEGDYKGGNISPGLEMRFKALHRFTKKLPLVKADVQFKRLIGNTTQTALISGVQNGILFEIKEYISRFKKEYPDLKIIFTGGDTIFFEKRIKNKIFADQNLVLKGLNIILNYNE
jgi:type III pantothenate kinase